MMMIIIIITDGEEEAPYSCVLEKNQSENDGIAFIDIFTD
jgi:hypothetical protein